MPVATTSNHVVMLGLVPRIHAFFAAKAWMLPRWRAKRAASAATLGVRAPDTRPEPGSSARA
jgi:hypothetical protein